MGQIDIGKGNHRQPPSNSLGIGFNDLGQLVRINANGSTTVYEPVEENPQNIIANKGVGLESNLPTSGVTVGDIYVTTDTLKVYTAIDSVSWSNVPLVKGQFVTDVLDTTDLPPVFQYYNSNLMPIANNVVTLP